MNISTQYQQHIDLMKSIHMSKDFTEARLPVEDSFEAIYNKAKDEDVDLQSAKSFLNSLSQEELNTLQKYSLLADGIEVDNLSNEGAYNLLVHHYEQYDFNNDGFTEVGKGQFHNFLPNDMPYEEKKAFVESYNQLEDGEKLMVAIAMLPNVVHVNTDGSTSQVAQSYSKMGSLQNYFKELLNSEDYQFNEEIKAALLKFSKLLEHYNKESQESNTSYYPSNDIVASYVK